MLDPQTLSTALLAAVPEDGSSIGNQALQDQLKTQFAGLTEAQFMAARDALIEAGQLRKGRGRGGQGEAGQAGAGGCPGRDRHRRHQAHPLGLGRQAARQHGRRRV